MAINIPAQGSASAALITLATEAKSTTDALSGGAAGQTFKVNEGTLWANKEWFASVAGTITVGTTSPAFYPRRVNGVTAAMSTGAAVSSTWLLSATKSTIRIGHNTVAGTQAGISVPAASRAPGRGTGSFSIVGDVGDTSTVDWAIEN